MPSWKTKKIGATRADKAASYPGQIHSVSRFVYRYLCCLCIKHPDTSLKFAWTHWDEPLYPPKEYWYSVVASFVCWCEIICGELSQLCLTPALISLVYRVMLLFLQLHVWLKTRCRHNSAVVSCHLSAGLWCASKDLCHVTEEVYEIPVGVTTLRGRLALCIGGPLWWEGWTGPFHPW